jgi:urease accessory protein
MVDALSTARAALTVVLTLTAGAALAHEGTGVAGGLASGLMHPIVGPDHVAAMVAVGLWGALLGAPAIWALPVAFPLVMAVGGALGAAGAAVPGVETGIAASALVIGLMVALALRVPVWAAAVIVGLFAVFHGHAHGTEMPTAASPLAYAIGFVIATGLLHLGGIAVGLLTKWPHGRVAVRTCGGLIALAGLGFITGAV